MSLIPYCFFCFCCLSLKCKPLSNDNSFQIRADVQTKGEFINDLIQKVLVAAYTDIEDVLKFVDWLDGELSSLVLSNAQLSLILPNQRSIIFSVPFHKQKPRFSRINCNCRIYFMERIASQTYNKQGVVNICNLLACLGWSSGISDCNSAYLALL